MIEGSLEHRTAYLLINVAMALIYSSFYSLLMLLKYPKFNDFICDITLALNVFQLKNCLSYFYFDLSFT